MNFSFKKDSTNVSIIIFIKDSTSATGSGLTGLLYNTLNLVCYYVRPGGNATQLPLITQTVGGAHSDGGFVEIDATNMPGVYRLDLADAVLATGSNSVMLSLKGAANMSTTIVEIQLESEVNISSLNGNSTSAANLSTSAGVILTGTVDTTAFVSTTTQFESDDVTNANQDNFNGRVLIFTSGALEYQATSIQNYSLVSGRGHFTVAALTAAPANDVSFVIV